MILTNDQISDIWEAMPGQPGGWLKEFGYIHFAQAIERAAIATYLAQQPKASEEVLSLHRRLAAEKLRADQGWQRADAKSKECIELRERQSTHIAGQSQATRAQAAGLMHDLMRFECVLTPEGKAEMYASETGPYVWFDHVLSTLDAPTAQEVIQQAAPESPGERMKCDDCDGRGHDGDYQWQGHFQPPEAGICNSCGGTGWADPTPVTQQAAKAETAEQAEGAQANVLPPFAAPASQHDARDPNWLLSTMDGKDWADEFCRLNNAADHGMMLAWFCNAIMTGYDTGRRHEAEEQSNTAGAAKGGKDKPNSSDLAPTTSTVSAPEEREIEWGHDLQSRLIAASQDIAENDEARNIMAEAACLLAALTGRTTSGKGEAA